MFTRDDLLNATGLTKASDYQVAIFEFIAEQLSKYAQGQPTNSLVVEAVAGSGKTTTVVAAAKLTKIEQIVSMLNGRNLRVLFLAFNKSIAVELGSRLGDAADAKTLNSLGHGIYSRWAQAEHGGVELDRYKTNKLMRELFRREQIQGYGDDVRFLVSMCKSLGAVPEGINGFKSVNGVSTSDQDLLAICRHFSRFVRAEDRPTVFGMVRTVLTESLKKEKVIDFDDQKYMTTTMRFGGAALPAFKYDVVILDEVQDVNAVDIALVKMVLKKNGIVIGVGDSRQAIYGFRGADTRSIENFKEAFNAKTLPLAITYRCGSEIVKHAQEIVPSIEAAPNAHEGQVEHLDSYTTDVFEAGDMILCRNNAPLLDFAFKLLAARIPVFVKGRDIGGNLIGQIEKLVGTEKWVPNPNRPGKKMKTVSVEGQTTTALAEALAEWRDTQIEIILKENQDDEESVQRINDQADTLRVFIDANTDGKVSSVIEDIRGLFDMDGNEETDANKFGGHVVLSTVHKSKGLEADRVFMLNYDLFYPRRLEALGEDSRQYTQEANLDYVARTRARNYYGYISDKGLQDGSANLVTDEQDAA
jgi:superfamily I DNA/RNA helicase